MYMYAYDVCTEVDVIYHAIINIKVVIIGNQPTHAVTYRTQHFKGQ